MMVEYNIEQRGWRVPGFEVGSFWKWDQLSVRCTVAYALVVKVVKVMGAAVHWTTLH